MQMISLRTTQATRLAELTEEYWQWVLKENPTLATYLGDFRYNDKLPDVSTKAREQAMANLREFKRRLARIDHVGLDEEDRITHDIFRQTIDLTLEEDKHKFYQWDVDQMGGPQIWLAELLNYHPLKTENDFSDLEKRFERFPKFVAQYIDNLKCGIKERRLSPKVAVIRVIEQLKEMLAIKPEESPFAGAYKKFPKDFKVKQQSQWKKTFLAAIKDEIYPAYRKLLTFFEKEYMEHAREVAGLWVLPGGKAAYQFRVSAHTTTDLTAEEIHQIGLEELNSIEKEMLEIAKKMGYKGDAASFTHKITSDPKNFAKTRTELITGFKDILKKVDKLLPKYFGKLPKVEYEIKQIEKYREKDAPAAFYYTPPDDFSRPGIFYANTYKPKSRPLYGMAALAVHEAVPGHHLQIALAMELQNLPAFRRHGGFTAYIEGWALYTERLAVEMGVYKNDMDRLGMLSFQALRAARLVVDTGIHHLKWTRDKALAFFREHVPTSEEEIVTEIDRYIIWPGQALAYMIGKREIAALRIEAEKEIGTKFNIKEFHDELLRHGALPLTTLRNVIERWITRKLNEMGKTSQKQNDRELVHTH